MRGVGYYAARLYDQNDARQQGVSSSLSHIDITFWTGVGVPRVSQTETPPSYISFCVTERVFSSAVNTGTGKRSHLYADKVEISVILKQNCKF